MSNVLYRSKERKYTYDFRKPRVKETTTFSDGHTRTEVMDKFSMGNLMVNNGGYWYGMLVTVYNLNTYKEVKQKMLELLEDKQFENVTIIK